MTTAGRTLRICIATHDIVGPIRNGGIGTAYYALAVALATAGHDVTVLYGLGRHCERGTIAQWRRHFARLGIRFVAAPEPAALDVRGSWAVRASYRTYLWLKRQQFDLVHCHEWRGIGYYALLAKHQGLAFERTLFCVGAHSPSFWHKEGMRETPSSIDDFEMDFLERESVRLADVVWSPSRHMLEWMQARGWPSPRRSFVEQYIMLDFLDTPPPSRARRPIDEFVFFGRLETRKGLDLFCDAMDRLASRGDMPARVLFMGKTASVDGVDTETYLARRAAAWPGVGWRIESSWSRDEAIAYLREPGRLAVLPSRVDNLPLTVLECLGAGIPFVSSDVGGIPEMVHPSDVPSALVPLDAERWADALARVLSDGAGPVRPAIPLRTTLRRWRRWHERLVIPGPRASRVPAARPLVSVCITHRNRPGFLRQALASIQRQTYDNFEVVLVDDGSDQPEARSYLDRLDCEFRAKGWTLVRQRNRFPGAARNEAARRARGAYLLFMDDDNIARPCEIATLVRALERSRADVVTCFLDVFQGARPPARAGRGTFRWTFVGACSAIGTMQNCFGDTNCLVRREAFLKVGGFTEDFGVGFEDWELLARLVLNGCTLTTVPEALVWYRQTGQGVNNTTALERNHMRALRPYLERLDPEQRNLLLLAKRATLERSAGAGAATTADALRADHLRRVVVFGAGEGGRLALRLAETCGWTVPYIVDNNTGLWGRTAHGHAVQPPASLETRDFDFILVASYAGRAALFAQLDAMGFSHRTDYAFFLDPVRVGTVQYQVAV
jgi:O-antigen biosynthesis protein